MVGGDDDVVALANTQKQPIRSIRPHRHKIMGNNLERVTIQTDTKLSINRRINNAKSVLLARSQGLNIVRPSGISDVPVLAVYEDVVALWGCATTSGCAHAGLEGRDVVPVIIS